MTEWTTTPPTEPGWYWADDDGAGEPEIIRVDDFPYVMGGLGVLCAGDEDVYPVNKYYTHWIGPLPLPAAPPAAGQGGDDAQHD